MVFASRRCNGTNAGLTYLIENNKKIIKMPVYLSEEFLEWECGEFINHRFDFSIGEHKFLVLFSPIDVSDVGYHALRSEEVGFSLPSDSYDVKFDRLENFESDNFYATPKKSDLGGIGGIAYLEELVDALTHIITLHCNTYQAKSYLMLAENMRLKQFYDRVLQRSFDEVLSYVATNLGEEGKGYALRTRYYET
ncbi:hypothetical protein KGP26_30090 (plasmid) [Serratia sp. JSRIV002]|uniref:hypothetical protein n=1 Tax=Serratia sp. JSRIV002 TaxID=2831894 RepID=UPI001CBB0F01|nr:hypothetical protein [Serratia sp. JSRIV002]UAN54707.1 hypothetical protein KGP26_30090 [Serratia sp. JSRIV002]